MSVRYMLMLPSEEIISCVGPLPREGESVHVVRVHEDGVEQRFVWRVTEVRYLLEFDHHWDQCGKPTLQVYVGP